MKNKYILLFLFLVSSFFVNAQVDKTIQLCEKYLVPPFVSDGQDYRSLLNNDEVAEFHMTLYGGASYRIIACSGEKEGNIIFSLYDIEKNLLFTNRDYQNSPYWDFEITNTIEVVLESELTNQEDHSGFVFISLAFKQK